MESAVLAAAPDDIPPDTTPQEHRITFTATGGEYFRIWIVNLLLTLVTLGIYGAWAKVRRLRYFYGSTLLADSSFEYHGDPRKILKGRLIAAALIAPYYIVNRFDKRLSLVFLLLFFAVLPFIVVKSRRFQMRVSSWRNIHFDFTGTYKQASKVFQGFALLIPLTLGLFYPYWIFARQRFILGESKFGATPFKFEAQAKNYYRAYGAAVVAFISSLIAVTVVIVGVAAVLGGFGLRTADPRTKVVITAIIGITAYIAMLATMMVPAAIVQARTHNEALNHTQIGVHALRCEWASAQLAKLYLRNFLLTVVTVGFYAPWAKIALLRYQLERISLITQGSVDDFVAAETAQVSATGEEVGDLLDLDFGL